MSTSVLITLIICVSLVVMSYINKNPDNNSK